MKTPIQTLTFMLFSLFAPVALHAAVTVTADTNAPTEDVIFSRTNFTGAYNWNGLPAGRRDVGQAFKAPENTEIDRLTLMVGAGSVDSRVLGANFTINIYQTSAYNITPTNGILVSTQSGSLPASFAGSDYLTFQLSTPVSVTNGQFYTFMLSFDSLAAGQFIPFATANTGDQDGDRWSYDGTTYTRFGDPVFTFYVQAVPEARASTLVLCALGMVFVLRRVFRTRAAK